jgi:hypothetical protein
MEQHQMAELQEAAAAREQRHLAKMVETDQIVYLLGLRQLQLEFLDILLAAAARAEMEIMAQLLLAREDSAARARARDLVIAEHRELQIRAQAAVVLADFR